MLKTALLMKKIMLALLFLIAVIGSVALISAPQQFALAFLPILMVEAGLVLWLCLHESRSLKCPTTTHKSQ